MAFFTTTARRAVALLTLATALTGCGGGHGEDPAAEAQTEPDAPLLESQAQAQEQTQWIKPLFAKPGLVTHTTDIADATNTGHRSLLAIGALDDGGHAVAWLGRDATDYQAPWRLWVQRYDRLGRKAGGPRQLPYSNELIDPRQLAALVRRDGTVVVAFATLRAAGGAWPARQVSAVRTRHFGLDGRPRGIERTLHETQWEAGWPPAQRHEDLAMAQWRDGRYLVGWISLDGSHRIGSEVQRLHADGRTAAPLDRLGPVATRPLQLLTLEAGGFIAKTSTRTPEGLVHAQLTQVDVHPPLGLPLAPSLPMRAFVLDLRSAGRVLVSGQHADDPREVVAPHLQWFSLDGREADTTVALPALPSLAVPLDDGGFVAMWRTRWPDRLDAQRLDAQGAPMGERFQMAGGPVHLAAPLKGRGLATAWLAYLPGETRVMTQRLHTP